MILGKQRIEKNLKKSLEDKTRNDANLREKPIDFCNSMKAELIKSKTEKFDYIETINSSNHFTIFLIKKKKRYSLWFAFSDAYGNFERIDMIDPLPLDDKESIILSLAMKKFAFFTELIKTTENEETEKEG